MWRIEQEKLERFSGDFGAEMVVLFGSAAKGQKAPDDFDIALFMRGEERDKYEKDAGNFSKLWMSLSESLDISPDKIDITFVSPKTPPLLLYHIAKDGRLLFGCRLDFLLFQLKAIKIFYDTLPFRRATTEYLSRFLYAR